MVRAYVFQADLLCEGCGKVAKNELDAAGRKPADVTNEATFDSDEYPKGPYAEGGGETDCPQHCHSCSTYLGAPLTQEGIEYVLEKVREHCVARIAGSRYAGDADVLKLWAQDLYDNYSLDSAEMEVVALFLDGVKARR